MSDQTYPDYSGGYGDDHVIEAEYSYADPPQSAAPVSGELLPVEHSVQELTSVLNQQRRQEGILDRVLNNVQYQRGQRELIDILIQTVKKEGLIRSETRVHAADQQARTQRFRDTKRGEQQRYEIHMDHLIRACEIFAKSLERIKTSHLPDWLKDRQQTALEDDFKRRFPAVA